MADERGVVRRIVWRELFPWILIFRTFRLAISPALLALATLGALLTPVGWSIAGRIFLAPDERAAMESHLAGPGRWDLIANLPPALAEYLPATPSGIANVYFGLTAPVQRMFDWNLTLAQTAYFLLGNLWTLAIWAFVGGVVTRIAVVQLSNDEAPDLLDSLRFVAMRYFWYFLAPLYPLAGVLLIMLPIALLGLVMRLDVGVVLAGILWVFVIAISLIAVWLQLGLLFGWPLMWPVVSAEREGDPFEAFSRSFSYVYGKPLNLFFYFVVAAIFGAVCWAVVNLAIEILIHFGFAAASWGAGGFRIREIQHRIALGETHGTLGLGAYLLGSIFDLVRLVRDGYSFSFFFAAAAAIYLLMRMDVDQKEMDEVYLEAEPEKFAPSTPVSPSALAAAITEPTASEPPALSEPPDDAGTES
jgi:hypothetical protein